MNSEEKIESSQSDEGWETYWQGTAEAGAFNAGGVSHPAFKAFWNGFFQSLNASNSTLAMLDIASGNGAVLECAQLVFQEKSTRITCVDLSPSAVSNIQTRFPDIRGLVCDARSIPLEDGSFQLVTSQFGVEYAGHDAIIEAARLLGPGGHLALLMHIRGGAIDQECSSSLQAIRALQDSQFVPLAAAMFRHGFEAVKGADRQPYENAALELAPAITRVEQILSDHGIHVAGDSIGRLYNDVGTIHKRLPNYDASEVTSWLARMDGEMSAYAERMASMTDSALDEEEFKSICNTLKDGGLKLSEVGPFRVPDIKAPLAWAILAIRQDED